MLIDTKLEYPVAVAVLCVRVCACVCVHVTKLHVRSYSGEMQGCKVKITHHMRCSESAVCLPVVLLRCTNRRVSVFWKGAVGTR